MPNNPKILVFNFYMASYSLESFNRTVSHVISYMLSLFPSFSAKNTRMHIFSSKFHHIKKPMAHDTT